MAKIWDAEETELIDFRIVDSIASIASAAATFDNMAPPNRCHGAKSLPRLVDDTTTMARREFEFFVTTEEPHQPEGAQRGLIRRLVMRNFFDAKWSGIEREGESSEQSSEATLKAKGSLKTRFRLGQVTKEGGKRGDRIMKRQRLEGEEQSVGKLGMVRTRSSFSNGAQQDVKVKSLMRSRAVAIAEMDDTAADEPKQKMRISVNISPSAHRFDPFDVLPVPGTQQLDLLFRLRKTPSLINTAPLHTYRTQQWLTERDKSGSRINSLTTNARRTWWTFISNDAGLLHATLATWALYGILVRGLGDLRVEKLRHKNEAIREINSKIGDADDTISDELVGTVATLASFEVSQRSLIFRVCLYCCGC